MAEGKHRYPSMPLVGVGGLIVNEGKILLVKRAFEPRAGFWAIPGGTLELGETLEEALVREVEEETGIKIKVGKLLGVSNLILRDKRGRVKYHFVLVDFMAKPLRGKPKPSCETPEVRWVSLKELDKYRLTKTTRRLIDKALKEGLLRTIDYFRKKLSV